VTGRPHALVTGASSGIGRAVVTRLLDLGWQVTGLSRRLPDVDHPGFRWREVDLADLAALTTALTPIRRVDAVVHAAGFQRTAYLGSLDPADGAAMWQVHVAAASHLVDALSARITDGGRIVLIGSRTMTGAPGKSQYAATKAALVGLCRSWAMELIDRRITVNVVAPGPTDTAMLADPGRRATPPTVPPLGRLVDPAEVAGTVAFLLGPDAGAITGQLVTICAGASL
jgi:3-oxoacyl-[acyl-carrier protein] reductase